MSRKRRFAIWIGAAVLLSLIVIVLRRIHPVAGDPGDSIWTETVRKGPMPLEVRGSGTLGRRAHSRQLLARVTLPDGEETSVRLNQRAEVQVRNIILKGHVRFISASTSNGNRSVDIALDGHLPEGAGEATRVDATVHVGELKDVLYVARPVHARANITMGVFKTVDGGEAAVRVMVKFGRCSANTIEVLSGLVEGDRIITADMSAWDQFDLIRLR